MPGFSHQSFKYLSNKELDELSNNLNQEINDLKFKIVNEVRGLEFYKKALTESEEMLRFVDSEILERTLLGCSRDDGTNN